MITSSIRLQFTSRGEAETVSAWLTAALGDTVALAAPHSGRGPGVWFVRGTLRVDPQRPAQVRPKPTTVEDSDRQFGNVRRFVDAIIRETGQVVQVPDPERLDRSFLCVVQGDQSEQGRPVRGKL